MLDSVHGSIVSCIKVHLGSSAAALHGPGIFSMCYAEGHQSETLHVVSIVKTVMMQIMRPVRWLFTLQHRRSVGRTLERAEEWHLITHQHVK